MPSKIDAFVKSPSTFFSVIPVKTGSREFKRFWTPAFAEVTTAGTFYEVVKTKHAPNLGSEC